MSEEDKKLQKHLVDEMMKVSKTNPDVMFYMEALMKKYEELEQKVEQKDKEIDRLNKEYERIYNENCKLRENHNINDITLLDENERLNRIIDNIFKFMQNKYDNSDLTGFTISFMELQDLKELKENNK